jgi:hypothetical protein
VVYFGVVEVAAVVVVAALPQPVKRRIATMIKVRAMNAFFIIVPFVYYLKLTVVFN